MNTCAWSIAIPSSRNLRTVRIERVAIRHPGAGRDPIISLQQLGPGLRRGDGYAGATVTPGRRWCTVEMREGRPTYSSFRRRPGSNGQPGLLRGDGDGA